MKYKLKEVTYQDAYGPTFTEFKKKYNKYKKDSSLFVQFTNFDLGFDNRKGYDSPDHSDPIGVYGYPLWYVLSNPSDIWYGQNASYMRVLKNVAPRKTLQLQYVTYSDIGNYAYKIKQKTGIRYIQDGLISKLEKEFKGYSQYGKIFFQLIQRQYDDKGDFKVRSNEEQTAILKKLGFWAIEDRASRSSQAVINDREPVQICFLVPSSFKVLDTYKLKVEDHYHSSDMGRTFVTDEPSDSFIRSIAQRIFKECFNDKIESGQKDSHYETKVKFRNLYFSKAGRMIQIEKFDQMDRSNLKLGQKPYKAYTMNNRWAIKIHIDSETVVDNYVAQMDDSIESVLQQIKEDIQSSTVNPNWIPYTKEKYIAHKEREYDVENQKWRNQEDEKKLRYFDSTLEGWKELASALNVSVPDLSNLDREDKLNFLHIDSSLTNVMNRNRYDIQKLEVYEKTYYPLKLMLGDDFLKYLRKDEDTAMLFNSFFYPILKKSEPYLGFYTYKSWEILRKVKGDE